MRKTNIKTTHTNNTTNSTKSQPQKCRSGGHSKDYPASHPKNRAKSHPKNLRRIINWPNYNEILAYRKDPQRLVRVLIMTGGLAPILPSHQNGHPIVYRDELILFMLEIRELFHLTLRETPRVVQSFLRSALIYGVKLPNYTTLSHRASTLQVELLPHYTYVAEGRDIIACPDSTGFKVSGEGEWKVRKHGEDKCRFWIEEHALVDYTTRDVLAVITTPKHTHDNTQLQPLLIQAEQTLEKAASERQLSQIICDGAYDSRSSYQFAQALGAKLVVPPPINATVNTGAEWEERNRVVVRISCLGRDEWKRETGYHRRSLAENFFSRQKTIFGDKSNYRKKNNQEVGLRIRAKLINDFNRLGLPKYAPVEI